MIEVLAGFALAGGLALCGWSMLLAERRERVLQRRVADLERNLGLALQSKSPQDYAARVVEADIAALQARPVDPERAPTLAELDQEDRKKAHRARMGWAQR